ncbi:MAG: hypothetical protein ACJ74Q_19160 [Pyrinomonadaceae bacterium]
MESLRVKIGSRALQVSERGRARSLLESLAKANADIRQGVAPELLARECELHMLGDERFAASCFRAAFTLQGEWR